MIIGQREQIFDGEPFAAGLARALRGVVRVSVGSQGSSAVSTGWVLTPRLVLVPAYAIEQAVGRDGEERGIRVEAMKKGETTWVDTVTAAPELLGPGLLQPWSAGPAIALLRLPSARPNRQLSLGFEAREPGDFLAVLHFPYARQATSVSFGRLSGIQDPLLSYDADTQPGSGGAPVFDARWTVIAVHMLSEAGVNRGLTRAALVELLQKSAWWPEIASCHRLADVAAAREQLKSGVAPREAKVDRVLVQAALSASVDPRSLSRGKAERLRPHVVDPAAKRWVLQPAVRQSVLRDAGPRERLLKLLPKEKDTDDAARRVVERILAGPPYDLAKEDEESLAWWIQAVRWFQGVVDGMPTPAEIARALERRRIRGRLAAIAGPGFRGRKAELDDLRQWFAAEPPVPLLVTGIGGVGKSALVARFASELPVETLLLWLDFDRADLAPDDALSVLQALAEQAAVQLEGFEAPAVGEGGWQEAAHALAGRLADHLAGSPSPLLVLDSFEVAQYSHRHEELWPVLEAIAQKIPTLRLVVTGRAPVQNLRLLDRAAKSRPITGLADADARAWLRDKGVTREDVLDRVIELADGIPLILRLALRLLDKGGSLEDLPEKLPPEIVAGFLYDRILDRVQDPDLKPVATAALVLRRLTVDMIQPVLGGLVEFPEGEPATWFADLGREMALVEGTDVLRLRPEVRAATLQLLERDRAELVRAVDERAARWYAGQDPNDVEVAAELVYHRLRLGDIQGAETAWRDGCGAFLQYAADELSAGPRQWLLGRLGEQLDETGAALAPVHVWEQEAAERIRSSRKRGLKRAATKILEERVDRSDTSLLAFHEAFEERAAGLAPAAIERLDQAGYPSGPVGRDRRVLRALLAADQADRRTAEQHLALVAGEAEWADRRRGELEALAVQAARVRLAADLDAEVALLEELQVADAADPRVQRIRESLSSIDVLLPRLVRALAPNRVETAFRYSVADDPRELRVLAWQVEIRRQETLPAAPPELLSVRKRLDQMAEPELASVATSWPGFEPGAPALLVELGWRRWRIATTTPFLAAACRLAQSSLPARDPMAGGILASLGLFAGSFHGLVLVAGELPLFELVQRAAGLLQVPHSRWEHARRVLAAGVSEAPALESLLGESTQSLLAAQLGDAAAKEITVTLDASAVLVFGWKAEARARALLFHLVAPDPLEQLVQSLAGEAQEAS